MKRAGRKQLRMTEKPIPRLLPPLSRDTALDNAIVVLCTVVAIVAIIIDYFC